MRQSATLLLLQILLALALTATTYAATTISFKNTTRINPGLLKAAISANPSHVKIGHAVSFLCTGVGGVSPLAYSWNFGDGTTGSASMQTHSYNSTGIKTVVCTITDFISSTAKNQTMITVT